VAKIAIFKHDNINFFILFMPKASVLNRFRVHFCFPQEIQLLSL